MMSQKFLEDWNVGEEYFTSSRTVTETDVVMFAAMTGDYNQIHTSDEFTRTSSFGQRIAHGLLGLSISHGLLSRLGFIEGSAIAFLGIESWVFKAPIYFNDTIHVRIEVKDVIKSRTKLDRGVIKLFLQIIKQDGTVCQEGIKNIMMKRKS
jgi:acyl dehydratase